MPNDPVIRTHGLSKAYKGVQALEALDLEVPGNSIFGFLGPNGAGKTTTIKLLLGLIRPTAGSAEVFGHDIVGDTIDVRRRIGYLAQEPGIAGILAGQDPATRLCDRLYPGCSFLRGPPLSGDGRSQPGRDALHRQEFFTGGLENQTGRGKPVQQPFEKQISYPADTL